MTTQQVHVVTAVRNRMAITKEFIHKLQKQTYPNIHLLLVDDGSSDGTVEMAEKASINKTIIRGDGNLWWGGALHQAYLWFTANEIEQYEFVLIMNDDVVIEDDFIARGISRLLQEDKVLLTGFGYGLQSRELIDGPVAYRFTNGISYIAREGEAANCASTHALFFRVRDFLAIGGFHPVLLPHYGSDYEFTLRAWKKGYRILSEPGIKYFFNEDTTGNMYYMDLKPSHFVKRLFSPKSVYNPIYKLTFILLVCPLRYIPVNLFFQMIRYMQNLFLYITRKIVGRKARQE
jgi:GT2 family glycosyltransferase